MSIFDLFLEFLKVSFLSSGGLAPLAFLQDEFITHRALLTAGDFASALAVGRISPGPNGLFVVSIGYYIAGVLGAFAGMIAIMIPPFLGILLVRAHRRLADRPWVTGLTRGVTVSSVGLLCAVGYSFGAPLVDQPASVLLFVVALAALLLTKVDALPVLGVGALLGVLLYFLGIPLA